MGFVRRFSRGLCKTVKGFAKGILRRATTIAVTAAVVVATGGVTLPVALGRMAVAEAVSRVVEKVDNTGVLKRACGVAATYVSGGGSLPAFQRALCEQTKGEIQRQVLRRVNVSADLKALVSGAVSGATSAASDEAIRNLFPDLPSTQRDMSALSFMLRAGEDSQRAVTGPDLSALSRGALGAARAVDTRNLDELVAPLAADLASVAVDELIKGGRAASATTCESAAGAAAAGGQGVTEDVGIGAFPALDRWFGFDTPDVRLSVHSPDYTDDQRQAADRMRVAYNYKNEDLADYIKRVDGDFQKIVDQNSNFVAYTTGAKELVVSVRGLAELRDVLDTIAVALTGRAPRARQVEEAVKSLTAQTKLKDHRVVLVGHSLGGSQVIDILRRNENWTGRVLNPGTPGVGHMLFGGVLVTSPPENVDLVVAGDDAVALQWATHQNLDNVHNMLRPGRQDPHFLTGFDGAPVVHEGPAVPTAPAEVTSASPALPTAPAEAASAATAAAAAAAPAAAAPTTPHVSQARDAPDAPGPEAVQQRNQGSGEPAAFLPTAPPGGGFD